MKLKWLNQHKDGILYTLTQCILSLGLGEELNSLLIYEILVGINSFLNYVYDTVLFIWSLIYIAQYDFYKKGIQGGLYTYKKAFVVGLMKLNKLLYIDILDIL